MFLMQKIKKKSKEQFELMKEKSIITKEKNFSFLYL